MAMPRMGTNPRVLKQVQMDLSVMERNLSNAISVAGWATQLTFGVIRKPKLEESKWGRQSSRRSRPCNCEEAVNNLHGEGDQRYHNPGPLY